MQPNNLSRRAFIGTMAAIAAMPSDLLRLPIMAPELPEEPTEIARLHVSQNGKWFLDDAAVSYHYDDTVRFCPESVQMTGIGRRFSDGEKTKLYGVAAFHEQDKYYRAHAKLPREIRGYGYIPPFRLKLEYLGRVYGRLCSYFSYYLLDRPQVHRLPWRREFIDNGSYAIISAERRNQVYAYGPYIYSHWHQGSGGKPAVKGLYLPSMCRESS